MNRPQGNPPPAVHPTLPPHLAFFRDGRRDLWRIANGLGFMLLAISASLYILPKAFSSLLTLIGYQGSLRYANFGNIEPSLYYFIMGSVYTLSLALPCLIYLLIRRIPIRDTVPSRKVPPTLFLSLFFIGLALCLFANVPSNWISSFIKEAFHLVPKPGGSSGGGSFGTVTPFALTLHAIRTTVLPGFFEEFVFRGILLGQLRRFGDGFAIFTSALLFGFFHGNLSQIPFAFLVGLVLGYIVVKTNNIWISVAVHFANNAVATTPEFLSSFLSDGVINAVSSAMFCAIFFLAILAAIYLFIRFRKVYIPQFPLHPLPLGLRMGAFFSSVGIILILLTNIGETIWDFLP